MLLETAAVDVPGHRGVKSSDDLLLHKLLSGLCDTEPNFISCWALWRLGEERKGDAESKAFFVTMREYDVSPLSPSGLQHIPVYCHLSFFPYSPSLNPTEELFSSWRLNDSEHGPYDHVFPGWNKHWTWRYISTQGQPWQCWCPRQDFSWRTEEIIIILWQRDSLRTYYICEHS